VVTDGEDGEREGNETADPAVEAGPEGATPAAVPAAVKGGPASAILEVILCSGLPTQAALRGLLMLAGHQPFGEGDRLSTTFVVVLSVADAVVLVALVTWLLRLHGERPRGVLFGDRPIGREALLGLLQVPFVFLLVVLVMTVARYAAPWLHNVPTNPLEVMARTPAEAALFVVVAILAGGVREEVQRAFILHRFEQHLGGAWVGLALHSVVFGSGHLLQGYDAALTTALLGVFWGVVFLRRRSIASTVVSHSAFNSIQIVAFVLVKG
jgi:membrane protease YdiL (CAAX protease family)